MRQVAALIVLFLLLAGGATSQVARSGLPSIDIDPKMAKKTVVQMCGSNSRGALRQWRPNLQDALRRLSAENYGGREVFDIQFVETSDCVGLESHACLGLPGLVMCNEDALERLVYASGMASGYHMLSFLEGAVSQDPKSNPWSDILRDLNSSELGPIEVLGLIDAAEADRLVRGVYAPGEETKYEKRKKYLVQAYGPKTSSLIDKAMVAAAGLRDLDTNWESSVHKMTDSELRFFAAIRFQYRAIVDEVLSFVVGHELAHAHGGCLVHDVSQPESSGRVTQFIQLQTDRRLFCPNPPSISEINADRCALRVLQKTDERLRRDELLMSFGYMIKPGMLNIARRHTIDFVALILAGGLGSTTQETFRLELPVNGRPQYRPELKRREGYLESGMRLLLVAELLRSASQPPEMEVGVCGTSADRLAESFLSSSMGCVMEHPLKQLTGALNELNLPMAPGIATFFTEQRNLDTRCRP